MTQDNIRAVSNKADLTIASAQDLLVGSVQDAKINFANYWHIFLRYKWVIIGMATIGAIIGGLQAISETPIYRASLTMVLEPERSNLTRIEGSVLLPYTWRFYETQYRIMRSKEISSRVVKKLKLLERGFVTRPPESTPRMPILKILKDISKYYKDLIGASEYGEDASFITPEPLTPKQKKDRRLQLTNYIQRNIEISGGDRSQVVSVSFRSPHPKLAMEVTDAVADAFVEFGLEARLSRTKRAGHWLTEQLEELRTKVVESEANLQAFQEKEGLVSVEDLRSTSSSRLSTFGSELTAAQSSYVELSKRYGRKHPKMIAAKAKLDQSRRRLQIESKQAVGAKNKEFALAKLEREVTTNRQLYDMFTARFKETDLSTDYKLSNVRVLDRADLPTSPISPDEKKIVSTWAFIGFFIGIVLVFLREYMDNTFRGHEKVEEKLKLPVLGIVPYLGRLDKKILKKGTTKNSSLRKVVPERHFIADVKSPFAEAINQLRTGVLYSNIDDPPVSILITSSLQSEGKTTLASNLALSLAQLGRTLLIDADLRKPRIAKLSGLQRELGLVEYVAGEKTLQECVTVDNDCPSLFILKSGVIPPNPLELLSSRKLAKSLDLLKKQFSHIVVDAAPILPVSDAIILSNIVDATVLVVQADKTHIRVAQDAVKRLRAASIKPLGVALSQVDQRKSSYYYRGNYYYSDYYSYAESKTRKAS
ncbi:GumC family protein [Pseudomonadota bacterium]